ncbi:MAG: hypothetical protein BWZ02_00029 [Lentisphaerae bacterium ADurb.BinA184]|nr:MAG: hypothetical protein BWZ02_00029 [Lentisphaerae bacterium ADurb.BinA184]
MSHAFHPARALDAPNPKETATMRTILALAAAVALLALDTSRAATISGSATLYANPFAGMPDSAYVWGGTDVTMASPLIPLNQTAGYMRMSSAVGATVSGWAQVTTATPFQAGTIVSTGYTGYNSGSTTYSVGIGSPALLTHGVDIGGAPTNSPWLVTHGVPVTSDTLRVEVSRLYGYNPSYWFTDIGKLLVIPDELVYLSATSGTDAAHNSPGTLGTYEGGNVVDLQSSTPYINRSTTDPHWFVLDITGGPKTIGAVVTDMPATVQTLDIQRPDGLGGWTTITSVTNSLGGEVVAVKFDASVPDVSELRFYYNYSGGAETRVNEVMLFSVVVPEPVSAVLLGLGLVFLPRRRRG